MKQIWHCTKNQGKKEPGLSHSPVTNRGGVVTHFAAMVLSSPGLVRRAPGSIGALLTPGGRDVRRVGELIFAFSPFRKICFFSKRSVTSCGGAETPKKFRLSKLFQKFRRRTIAFMRKIIGSRLLDRFLTSNGKFLVIEFDYNLSRSLIWSHPSL